MTKKIIPTIYNNKKNMYLDFIHDKCVKNNEKFSIDIGAPKTIQDEFPLAKILDAIRRFSHKVELGTYLGAYCKEGIKYSLSGEYLYLGLRYKWHYSLVYKSTKLVFYKFDIIINC